MQPFDDQWNVLKTAKKLSSLFIEDKRIVKKISKPNFSLELRDEQKNSI